MMLLLNLVEEPTHWRLSVHGNLEFSECRQFRLTANRILASPPHAAVVDLSNLGRLDHSGLGVLVDMCHAFAAAGRQLVLVISDVLQQLLGDARLHGIFCTAQTLEGAIGMLKNPIEATPRSAFSAV
jgi:anti-anti-sigma regulatory factor